jgi:hypothetical protein
VTMNRRPEERPTVGGDKDVSGARECVGPSPSYQMLLVLTRVRPSRAAGEGAQQHGCTVLDEGQRRRPRDKTAEPRPRRDDALSAVACRRHLITSSERTTGHALIDPRSRKEVGQAMKQMSARYLKYDAPKMMFSQFVPLLSNGDVAV